MIYNHRTTVCNGYITANFEKNIFWIDFLYLEIGKCKEAHVHWSIKHTHYGALRKFAVHIQVDIIQQS